MGVASEAAVKVYALLSWYDEQPEHLTRCVRSLKGFADVLVALDGAYATFPNAQRMSAMKQRFALQDAAYASGISYKITEPYRPWQGGEVEKRAALFELARRAGATPDDWFLIIDGDMELASYTPEARELLAASALDIAEVRWHDVRVDGVQVTDNRFRSLFRALPGLTVERAHYLYVVPCDECDEGRVEYDTDYGLFGGTDPCESCKATGRRFLWHTPDGHFVEDDFLDLHEHVTLHHYNSGRDGERKRRAMEYYRHRDDHKLEGAGDWHRRP